MCEIMVCACGGGRKTVLRLYESIPGAGRESRPSCGVYQKGQGYQCERTPDGQSSDFNFKIMKEMRGELSNEKEKTALVGVLFQDHLCPCFVDEDSKVERLPYS